MKANDVVRTGWRLASFGALLIYALAVYVVRVVPQPASRQRRARIAWLSAACRRQLRQMNIHVRTRGQPPARGLIVANHLGYLDVLILSALVPCAFVSKKEVARWPVFGFFARLAGTLFIDRERRAAVSEIGRQMQSVLEEGCVLAFFPEGTSSDGTSVLPFKTSLFEPVARLGCPVTAVALRFNLAGGSVREEIHWWGDMPLAPHFFNLIGKPRIDVTVCFGPPRARRGERKAIAQELHAEVLGLYTAQPREEVTLAAV